MKHILQRTNRKKLQIVFFILLFLTVITSLLLSNAVNAEQQAGSDILTFHSLGVGTETFSCENGEEVIGTIEFEIDVDDNTHNRYALHLQYMVSSGRPDKNIELEITTNEEHIKESIFRFVERDTKQWRSIEIPVEYLTNGENSLTIDILLKSRINDMTALTLYSDSYFEIKRTVLINSAGDYDVTELGVLPTTTYEEDLLVTGMFGGFYSLSFTPQIEFYLQSNMTSSTTSIELSLQQNVPSDCDVTYNIYLNDEALLEEDRVFDNNELTIHQGFDNLQAGRNSIRIQLQIESYQVKGGGASGNAYDFMLKVTDNSRIIFSGAGESLNGEGEGLGDMGTIPFALMIAVIVCIPAFLVIVKRFRRKSGRADGVRNISYSGTGDSNKLRTLRAREDHLDR